MGGKNNTRKCIKCGDSVDGLYTRFCYPCLSRRRKEKREVRFAAYGAELDTCIDCGRSVSHYAMRCAICDRAHRLVAKREQERQLQRTRGAWYRDQELGQYAISDPGWFIKEVRR